jgi:hypothetical protein
MHIDDERNVFYDMVDGDKEVGYTVPEIRMASNHHYTNVRKWIHRSMNRVSKESCQKYMHTNYSR